LGGEFSEVSELAELAEVEGIDEAEDPDWSAGAPACHAPTGAKSNRFCERRRRILPAMPAVASRLPRHQTKKPRTSLRSVRGYHPSPLRGDSSLITTDS